MPKNILIFADGTGQLGGLKPDQRLSNVYKMYRAMRPDPSSPISPHEQVCFYEPGLGSGEAGGFTLRRLKNILAAAFGTGIDENVTDCYAAILSWYEPGDRVLLIGFSRGAYTVRATANVMNVCGIPTRMPDGGPIPRFGPALHQIAGEAVNKVYNHGNGRPRGQQPFLAQREELGRRFRRKYGSFDPDAAEDVQGNVQPSFIGVFDTVAALGVPMVALAVGIVVFLMLVMVAALILSNWNWLVGAPLITVLAVIAIWYVRLKWSQWKYFSPDENHPLSIRRIGDWPQIWRNGHYATWNLQNYDRWLDSDVGHARHALSIDERRKTFPRVEWGMAAEAQKADGRSPCWLKQVWFAGCHSDIGGSYPEPESRLSDIALSWMVDELRDCVPEVQINDAMLYRTADPLGMQHEEAFAFRIGPISRRWPVAARAIPATATLHPSVLERLNAPAVSHLGEIRPYRPEPLRVHEAAKHLYQ
ncbi:DUF2235 domain-containing protein [Paracoccus zhejiangensis]|uniref:T6SS Phospholipase effector Tle1-like catalytic domain-containing protein n=1 Tax=Paracoccus zhejiangensis TaxID=1077935 RepID=A0A2H5F2C9_9RHOB|nr:DUF2235 domain-containing protein [Paracoccus zhejiangensis]AUH65704.1 hypothetical protein CX676_17370 [Paracoccus zhejiangensis]